MLTPAHTRKKLRVNQYVYSCTIPFASRYMTKSEERSLATMCNIFLNTSHSLSSLLVCLFSSLSYSGIPVTESQCVWPDYNGYRHTEWARSEYLLHREGANPILELSQSLATPSDIPRTYFTTSHLREDSSKNQSMSSCVKQLDTLMV